MRCRSLKIYKRVRETILPPSLLEVRSSLWSIILAFCYKLPLFFFFLLSLSVIISIFFFYQNEREDLCFQGSIQIETSIGPSCLSTSKEILFVDQHGRSKVSVLFPILNWYSPVFQSDIEMIFDASIISLSLINYLIRCR